ncbi:peptidoglycan-binding protein [Kitasatospora sp. NPDC093102]|uniref:peptidoglycan-binding protein n=1 Tax=Kitasatospora sp. NPDC093102 TaxID=3155069 RepID=UPI0034325358
MPANSRRRSVLIATALVSVVLSGAGAAASLVIKSPAQAAAETGPPAPDVLTARVEWRVLTSTVVTRGQVTAGRSVDVAPVGAGTGAGAIPVVTRLPLKAGAEVTAATPVLEVAGRPVFALQGELPVYRDLKPGTKGPDVKQLQEALAQAGFPSSDDVPGTFGAATKSAVAGFYAARGYDPLPSSPDGDARVTAAKDAVTAGERVLSDAREALASDRTVSGTGSAPPAGAGGRAGSGRPSDGVGPEPAAATKQVTRAAEDLTRLRARLAEAEAARGPMVPATELVFLPSFPARVESVAGQVGSMVSGKVLALSAGALVVRGSLTASDRGLVQPGQKVEILSELTGAKASATVTSVADSMDGQPEAGAGGTSGGAGGAAGSKPAAGPANTPSGPGFQLIVQPDEPLDFKLANQDVRLTIVAASSAGPVLTVPLSALSATADGRTVVTVSDGGQRRRVEVSTGTAGGGNVEVRPMSDGSLRESDQVIVGVKAPAAGPGAGAR